MCIDIAEILLVGTVVAHLASLAVGVALYGVEELGASGNVENLVYLLQCGIADLSQGSCTLLAVRVGELSENPKAPRLIELTYPKLDELTREQKKKCLEYRGLDDVQPTNCNAGDVCMSFGVPKVIAK